MQNDSTTEQKLTPKKAAFLAAYPEAGTVTGACEAAKISRTIHYVWLQEDGDYREAFELAKAELTESLEREAVRRARDGWNEPVFHEGKVCGFKRRFSDTLLIFLLKANNPEKYRETIRNELTGRDGEPLQPFVAEIRLVKANHESEGTNDA